MDSPVKITSSFSDWMGGAVVAEQTEPSAFTSRVSLSCRESLILVGLSMPWHTKILSEPATQYVSPKG